jgi:DNA-binding response OmpR family regulator
MSTCIIRKNDKIEDSMEGRTEMIKILIVEDDPNIAKLMEATVAIGGYDSEVCSNGSEAFEKIERTNYDLILLDVMLPDMSGFEIMKKRTNTESPVIFITAKQELTDKVRGLRLGAEDYIVKPFEAMELLARIEVILRRVKRTERVYHYGDISVNVEEHTCKCGGEEVYLTPKEFEVLVFFIQHKDVAISRDRLLAAVWGFEYEGESRTIDIHIQQLRKKLNLKDRLVTIPKLGYRLESAKE